MLIQDFINDINNGNVTIKKFAEINKINEKKLRNVIKNAGFVYEDKKYVYKANVDISNVYIDDVLDVDLNVNDFNNVFDNVTDTYNKGGDSLNVNENDKKRDIIGSILSGKFVEEDKKVLKSVYFDSEIAKIIDTIPKKSRSILINEIIKIEFEKRGLLR